MIPQDRRVSVFHSNIISDKESFLDPAFKKRCFPWINFRKIQSRKTSTLDFNLSKRFINVASELS